MVYVTKPLSCFFHYIRSRRPWKTAVPWSFPIRIVCFDCKNQSFCCKRPFKRVRPTLKSPLTPTATACDATWPASFIMPFRPLEYVMITITLASGLALTRYKQRRLDFGAIRGVFEQYLLHLLRRLLRFLVSALLALSFAEQSLCAYRFRVGWSARNLRSRNSLWASVSVCAIIGTIVTAACLPTHTKALA